MARQRRTCKVKGWGEEQYYIISSGGNNKRVVPVANPQKKGVLVPNGMILDERIEIIDNETAALSSDHSVFRACMYGMKELNTDATLHDFFSLLIERCFLTHRRKPGGYKGEVFLDRDELTYDLSTVRNEKRLVAHLYHKCRETNNGVLCIGSSQYWLLGFEFPTQGGNAEKQMKADLVGLTIEGGIVVFECKRGDHESSDPPAVAFAEGLDYAANLLRRDNFEKLKQGFLKWRSKDKDKQLIPQAFQNVQPDRSKCAEVVILAPEEYFVKHSHTCEPDFVDLCKFQDCSL